MQSFLENLFERIKDMQKNGSICGRVKDYFRREGPGLLKALLAALFIRSFIIQPFIIPSGSMIPSLLIGDFIVASKWNYGYGDVSLPFSPPVFKHKVWAAEPKVGDIVIFRGPSGANKPYPLEQSSFSKALRDFGEYAFYFTKKILHFLYLAESPGFPAEDDGKDYIKRVVGLPGDRIQMIQGKLHINGKPLPIEKVEPYYETTGDGRVRIIPQYIETLPNGVHHPILKALPFGEYPWDNTPEFVVPEGHFFAMGDNRDGSWDSRDPKFIGFVPFNALIGKAQYVWFSTPSSQIFGFLEHTRWSRIGRHIQ